MIEVHRVKLTAKAREIIDLLRQKTGGELMFHQSGGCCDGSAPMCFQKGEFKIGSQDVWVDQVHGCDFFMSADQFEYWKYSELTLDVVEGRGSSFSIEIPLGVRFLIRSRLYKMEEFAILNPVKQGNDGER